MTAEGGGLNGSFRSRLRSFTTRGRRLASSESAVGAARLASGTAAGQIILVAVSPILTRLYSPSDFGSLAVFVSLVGLVLVVSAGGYNFAIMLPKEQSDATVVVGLSLLLVAVTSMITAVVAVVLVVLGVFADSLGNFVLLWPLAVFFGGVAQVLAANAIRYGKFGLVAGANLLKASVTAVAQIVFGVLGFGSGGLMTGNFLGMSSANVRLAKPVVADLRQTRPSLARMRAAAREYSQFPLHTMPANLINVAFLSGTPLIVGWLFGTVTLGFWSLANSFVYMPSTLVSQAVGQAYYRKAVAVRESTREAKRLFDRTVTSLAALSFIPFALLAVVSPYLFAFVFGEEWRVAGQYAQVMMPAVWVRFFSAPVSTTALAHSANRVQLVTTSLQLMAVAVTVVVTLAVGLEPLGFLILLSALLVAVQAVSLLLIRRTIGRGQPPVAQDAPESL